MTTSKIDPSLPPLTPTYQPSKPDLSRENPQTRALISHLNLQPHIEGGYFVETDRDARRVPNPFLGEFVRPFAKQSKAKRPYLPESRKNPL